MTRRALGRLKRRSVAAARRRLHPLRPPLHDPARVAQLSEAPTHRFITGNGFAARCRFVINYDVLTVNEDADNDWWFCRTDYLEYFFSKHEPGEDYILFSHNSDRAIDASLQRFLWRRRLRAWFATDVEIVHPKLFAIPQGIANPRWAHGDGEAIARVQSLELERTILFDASYDVATWPPAREYCREQTGVPPGPRREFEEFLRDLASSYFCIAPRGKGIDTHRVWEALYLRTVPIVTRSVLSDQHPDLPMIVLDDWSDFRSIEFTPELYARTVGTWTPDRLTIDPYFERIEAILKA
ncbi:MAG: hypothetical protein JOY72_07340 [Actinobacteria bacterium]|nr:hypothetical protein [Actinomycetota bacterium]